MTRPEAEMVVLTPEELDQWAEDYLDGRLAPREAARFERRLLEPAVAEALGQALALRELLGALPPVEPPQGLVAEIERSLGVAEMEESRERNARPPRLAWLRTVLAGMSWAVRGPAQAWKAPPAGDAAGRAATVAAISLAGAASGIAGLRSVGYAVPAGAAPSLSSLPRPRLSWVARVFRRRGKEGR